MIEQVVDSGDRIVVRASTAIFADPEPNTTASRAENVQVWPGVTETQWTDIDDLEGLLVLFIPAAAGSGPDPAGARRLDDAEWALVRAVTGHLEAEYARALRRPDTEAR